MKGKRLRFEILLVFVAVPLCLAVGSAVFHDRRYLLVSFTVAVISCAVFYFSFEKSERGSERIVLLAVMTALSVAGRALFAPVPFFKPVTAIVILCGINMGAESGFLCGSLSAFLSNFIFMQGPWTPFQMFIWGVIGFTSGIMSDKLRKSRVVLYTFGAVSGVIYSAFMDIWTTVWFDGTFITSRYIAAIIAALPITAIYAASNVFFLMILEKTINKKFERIKKKYDIY